MRIAFDTSPLVRPYPPGVARACAGLLDALTQFSALEVIALAPASGENERSWRQRRLPKLVAQSDCAGLHSPISAFPYRGPGRRVQTLHELPWHHGATENADLVHRFWARFGAWRADAVICPTHTVRADVLVEAPGAAAKVYVCPWGSTSALASERETPEALELVRVKYRLPREPFVLAIGAVRAKKRLAATLHALAADREQPVLHVVVTGPWTDQLAADLELARTLGLEGRVHACDSVSDADLSYLIDLAGCVVVLSSSEGFGLPVLEAMSRTTPVVVSAFSAQAEVAGACGIAVDALDPRAVAAGLRLAFSMPPRERESLRERAQSFTWQECARRVEEIWQAWA